MKIRTRRHREAGGADVGNRFFRRWGWQSRGDADAGHETPEPTGDDSTTQTTADDAQTPQGSGWTAGTHMVTTAIRAAVWAALVCGPAALVYAITGGTSTPSVIATSSSQDTMSARAATGEFAERFVTDWLHANNTDDLSDYLAVPDEVQLPDDPVADTSAAEIAQITQERSGAWSITVGADVQDTDQDKTHRRYYQVSVAYDSGAMAAMSLPTPMPAPQTMEPPNTAYSTDLALDSAPVQAVADFLAAALTGKGDLDRYISPGAGLRPVSPTPYKDIEIAGVESDLDLNETSNPDDGTTAHVFVTATAETPDKGSIPIQYALTLRSRDGRWEIAAIDPTPQIEQPSR